mgnify:CR=1 FL=1
MRPLLISCLALAVATGCSKKSEVVQAELAADAAAEAEARSLDSITVTGTRVLEAKAQARRQMSLVPAAPPAPPAPPSPTERPYRQERGERG